jgi:hypothetical protein
MKTIYIAPQLWDEFENLWLDQLKEDKKASKIELFERLLQRGLDQQRKVVSKSVEKVGEYNQEGISNVGPSQESTRANDISIQSSSEPTTKNPTSASRRQEPKTDVMNEVKTSLAAISTSSKKSQRLSPLERLKAASDPGKPAQLDTASRRLAKESE